MAKRARTTTLVAAALALICLGGAAGTLAAVLAQPPTRSDVVTALAACVQGRDHESDEAKEACIGGMLSTALPIIGLAETNLAIGEAEELSKEVSGPCHIAAHREGRRYYADQSELMAAFPGLAVNACQSGLLHGSMEGWADASPSDEQVETLALACESLAGNPQTAYLSGASGRCGEAIGHASWLARNSPSMCRFLTSKETREQCGIGVLMQMYQPAGLGEPLPGATYESVLAACEEWRAYLAITDCKAGASYPFSLKYTVAVRDAREDPSASRWAKSLAILKESVHGARK